LLSSAKKQTSGCKEIIAPMAGPVDEEAPVTVSQCTRYGPAGCITRGDEELSRSIRQRARSRLETAPATSEPLPGSLKRFQPCFWRRTKTRQSGSFSTSTPTDDPLHGHQEGRFFHGYYDRYCYLPLYIFCGPHLLAAK
jgi:hypothetical protein